MVTDDDDDDDDVARFVSVKGTFLRVVYIIIIWNAVVRVHARSR